MAARVFASCVLVLAAAALAAARAAESEQGVAKSANGQYAVAISVRADAVWRDEFTGHHRGSCSSRTWRPRTTKKQISTGLPRVQVHRYARCAKQLLSVVR